MRIDRQKLGVVLIAALAIGGLGFTAATISSTYASDIGSGIDGTPGADGDGSGPDQVNGEDGGDAPGAQTGESQQPFEIPQYCVEILTQIQGILGLLVGFALIVGLAYFKRGFMAATISGYVLGIPMLIAYGLLTQCSTAGGGNGGSSPLTDFIAESGGAITAVSIPSSLLIGVFILAAIAAIAAVFMSSGSEEIQTPTEEEPKDADLGEFAAVAGNAADRIEFTDAGVDNAVYSAWKEMTDLLAIDDPETSTPGQFAASAVETGLNEDDVSQLTRVFEEVRYGEMDPEPREEMAVETLRNIESTYSASENVTADEADETDTKTDGEL